MSEDIIVIAIDDKIAWHRNEVEALEKMKAEHIARTGAKIKRKPGPAPGTPRPSKNNGENNPSKQDDRLSSRDESVTLTPDSSDSEKGESQR